MNETLPDPGDDLEPVIPVDRILAYGVGKLPLPVVLTRIRAEAPRPERQDGTKVRVDGEWVDL